MNRFRPQLRTGLPDLFLSQQFNLQGVAEKISTPLLVIQGALDRIVPADQGKRIAAEAGKWAELWFFADGNHVCNNIPYEASTTTGRLDARKIAEVTTFQRKEDEHYEYPIY